MLRPDAEDGVRTCRQPVATFVGAERHRVAGEAEHLAVVGLFDRARNEVHRWRADETGDEQVGRPVEHGLRLGELLDFAALHDGDAVGQRQRLDLVVGDVDHGVTEVLVQPLDLDAQFRAQFGVEVGQRLVEQEHVDIAHQRPPDRNALALTAGQGRRLAVEKRFDLQDLGGSGDAFGDFRLGDAGHLQPEGEIAARRHLRIERIGLEHHGDAAVLRLLPGDVLSLDDDLAAGDGDEPGNRIQKRRLAAAGGAEQHQEFALGDLQVHVLDDVQGAEADVEVTHHDGRFHGLILSLRRWRCHGRTSVPTQNTQEGEPARSGWSLPC